MSKRSLLSTIVGLVLGMVFISPAMGDITTGLVGYWALDDGSGTIASDASAYENHGTLMGGPTWVAGRFGQALDFDGVDDYVIVESPNHMDFSTGSNFSLTAWVKIRSCQSSGSKFIEKKRLGAEAMNLQAYSSDNYPRFYARCSSGRNGTAIGTTVINDDTWHFLAGVKEGNTLYLYVDGVLQATNESVTFVGNWSRGVVRIGHSIDGGPRLADGLIDEVRIYSRALSAADIMELASSQEGLPTNPAPANSETDVPVDSLLSWTPGEFAVTHDVYFGTSPTDVNAASAANPLDVLVSQGQSAATYDPGRLDFGTTYYWRVDEVNGAPDNTVYKGDVWSFTTEPVGYPLTNVTATASSFTMDMGPDNTVDGSGLTDDQHSTESTAMWLTAQGTQLPAWIQYEFEQANKLHELWVWNSNQNIESLIGFSAKDVTIEYSVDGAEWSTLRDEVFARASGGESYPVGTIVDMAGVQAKFVRLTITSNWGGMVPQTGLSEVRFFYVPVQARAPEPASGATDVAVDSVLSWRAGREVVTHEVYLSTDEQAVIDGTAPVEVVTERRFAPLALEYGQIYYWKVNEVNEAATPSTREGDLWSFSTQEYVAVDDFESYTNDSPKRLFQTWIDGLGFSPDDFFPQGNAGNGTGAIVGYDPMQGDVAEKTIIQSGRQSMPLAYDNTGVATAETRRTFAAQDWTAHGLKSLSLYFYGDPGNTGQLYLKINSTKVPYNGAPGDLGTAAWQVWLVDLSTVGGNLKNVTSLTIGIEGAGATGILYIDDMRLYPRAPEYITPVQPDNANLLAQYDFEGNANDSSGNGLNGTLVDGQLVSPGKLGQGMALQVNDAGYVGLGNPAVLNFATGDWTITAWFKTTMTGTADADKGTIFAKGGDNTGGHRYSLGMSEVTDGIVSLTCDDDVTKVQANSTTKTNDDVWHFVAGQRDGTSIKIYIDGRLEGTNTVAADYSLAGAAQHNAYIGAVTDNRDASLYKLFVGLIDDVRVYDRALSEGEILWLAGKTVPVAKPF